MQQYKDRDPKWIKLDRELLNNYEFTELPDDYKYHVIGLRLLVAQIGNKLPNNPEWLQSRIASNSPINLDVLIRNGFLESFDGKEICVRDCTGLYTEKRREKKNREEKTTLPDNLNNPTFIKAWEEWVQHRKEIKKKLTPSSIGKQLKLLNKDPKTAIATIERSIQNGWQGLFPDGIPAEKRVDPLKAKFIQDNPQYSRKVI